MHRMKKSMVEEEVVAVVVVEFVCSKIVKIYFDLAVELFNLGNYFLCFARKSFKTRVIFCNLVVREKNQEFVVEMHFKP